MTIIITKKLQKKIICYTIYERSMIFMAFAPNVAKEWYKNLSIEQLEAKYESLKHNYCFNNK